MTTKPSTSADADRAALKAQLDTALARIDASREDMAQISALKSDIDFAKAADEVQRFLRGFQALSSVAPVIGEIARLQNHRREVTGQLDKARADIVAAQSELAQVLAVVQQQRDDGIAVMEQAKANAASIVRGAEQQRAEILAQADAEAQAQRDAFEAERAEMQAKLDAARHAVAQVVGS